MPVIKKLVGTSPSQVPRNKDLGSMAFQNYTDFWTMKTEVSFRNKIINGAMQVDQRLTGNDWNNYYITGGSASTADGYYTYITDMWFLLNNGSGATVRGQQWNDTVGGHRWNTVREYWYEPNFRYCVRIFCATGANAPATGEVGVGTWLEAYQTNSLHRGWYQGEWRRVYTLSFWVRSTVRGNYTVSIFNKGANESYLRGYTIDSVNRWERKEVTFWAGSEGSTQNEANWRIMWDLGSGTNFQKAEPNIVLRPDDDGTAWKNTNLYWQTGRFSRITGSTNWIGTTGNYFYLGMVQLEHGDRATPFEYRPYAVEMEMCRRYLYVERYDGGANGPLIGHAISTTDIRGVMKLPTRMRIESYRVWTMTYTSGLATITTTPAPGSGQGQFCYMTSTFGHPSTMGSFEINYKTYDKFNWRQHSTSASYTAGAASLMYVNSGPAFLIVSAEMDNTNSP